MTESNPCGIIRWSGWFLVFVLFSGWSAAEPAEAKSAVRNTVEGMGSYLKGVSAVKKRDYEKGIGHLAPLVDTHPAAARWQDGALFWLAVAHLAHDNPKRDIEKSRMYLRRLLKAHPKSGHRWQAENYLLLIEEILQPRREVKRIKEEMLKE